MLDDNKVSAVILGLLLAMSWPALVSADEVEDLRKAVVKIIAHGVLLMRSAPARYERCWLSHWKPCRGPVVPLPNGSTAVYPGEYDHGALIHDFKSGKTIARPVTLGDGEWMILTSDGYYVASSAGERRLKVRAGGASFPIDGFRSTFAKPDQVKAALAPLIKKE